MKFKQIISAATAASIAASSLFATAVTAEAEATMYTYTYEKTSHMIEVAEGGQDTASGLYASSNTNVSLPGVTAGTTTYAELAAIYTGFTVEGFALEECTVNGFTTDDFEIYTFLMHDNWEWKQVNSATMTFAELGLTDASVIQTMGYILRIKDSALVDSGISVGDKIFVNNGNAEYYTYSCGAEKHSISVAEGGEDLVSGQWASVNKSIAMPNVSYGTTTFSELKNLYVGVNVRDFVLESSSITTLTVDDFEIYIYLMHGDNWSWVNTTTPEMIFSNQSIDDFSVIQEIGYSLRIKESALVNLGLSIGDTVKINYGNIYFEYDILCWNEVEGADHYLVKISNGETTVTDYCFFNSSSNYRDLMVSEGFEPGTYTINVYSVDENLIETLVGSIDYELTLVYESYGSNVFYYEDKGDGTAVITGGKINDGNVVIPSQLGGLDVTEIADDAFFANFDIETLVISEGIKKLGWYSFNYCQNITKVTLPESLEYIDSWAFEHCSSLETIHIPANVSTIKGGAFAQNDSLTSITCDSANPNYTSVSGVLFTKDMKALIAYPGGINGSYTVPDTVNHIGDAAFYGARGITSVEILGVLDFIGFEAFAECELLTDVKINEGVTYVGYWAFRGCDNIKKLTVPQSVTNIGNEAFGFKDYESNKYDDFTLCGYTGSAIYYYAIRHDIPFISLGDVAEENAPFIDENETENEVITNPNASKEDTITSITVNPAFNLKDKSDMGVGLDLTDIKVKAKEIYDGEGLERAEAALGQDIVGNKHYNLLDITLMSGNNDISNNYDGLVKVIIPIPTGHRDKDFYCYRILDDGTKELIPGRREGNDYVVYLEHFSIYALVADGLHVCSYSEKWESNEDSHWHECECGASSDMASHIAEEWIIDSEATFNTEGSKHKECTICGYITETVAIPATGNGSESENTPVLPPVTTPAYTGRPSIVTTTTAITTTTLTTTTTISVEEDKEMDEDAEDDIDVEIDEDTDTTKPADDDISDIEEDAAEQDESSEIDGNTESESDNSDDNPVTSVMLSFSAITIAAFTVIFTKKKK